MLITCIIFKYHISLEKSFKPATMRNITVISSILSAALITATAIERKLSIEISPVPQEKIIESDLWDFSFQRILSEDAPTVITIIGDSLMSEALPDLQHWFGVKGNSLIDFGEENRTYMVYPDSLPVMFRFPLTPGVAVSDDYNGRGRIYSRYPMAERGIYSAEVGKKGSLILAAGDTVGNVTVTRQSRSVLRGINQNAGAIDALPPDSLQRYEISFYRWYVPADPLPVAVMMCVNANGTDFSRAFMIDPSDYSRRQDQSDSALSPDLVTGFLTSATVSLSDREVSVTCNVPDGIALPLSTDIVDLQGNLYLHRENVCSGATVISLPVTDLNPGEYLVVLTTPVLPEIIEKRFIRIH